jgi:hypothetical protein
MRIKSQAEPTGPLIAAAATMAVLSFFAPVMLLHAVGLESAWYWLARQSAWLRWPVFVTMWGCSFVVITGCVIGATGFAVRLVQSAGRGIVAISEKVNEGLNAAFYGGGALTMSLLSLVLYPVRLVCEFAWERAQGCFSVLLQRWREEQELRRLYREEFSGDFPNFRAFRRHFYEQEKESAAQSAQHAQREQEQQQQQQEQAKKRDAFVDACKLLGLPEDGEFTPALLKQRYYALIRNVHPDIAGPNELALQVNAAHACIKKRKGWS